MLIEGKRNDSNKLYRKVRRLWHSMMDRCYNENHSRYHLYGGNGIFVNIEWHTLNGFIDTIDSVKGFDMPLYLDGKLTLDKDSLDITNKEYSIEKCVFVSLEENNKYKPNQQKEIIAISPCGTECIFFNQSEFSREHNLNQSGISDCLKGRIKVHKGWKFKYKK